MLTYLVASQTVFTRPFAAVWKVNLWNGYSSLILSTEYMLDISKHI